MFLKRAFDLTFSIIGLILAIPVFILIAFAIIIITPGPILFVQDRIGKNGLVFRLLKFRTMTVVANFGKESTFDAGDKSRITSIGRILRKTKLDELPQLYNILKGDMSFVGPRPEIKKWTLVYPEKWIVVHQVKPGITDNASIMYYNEEEILTKSTDPEDTYLNLILPRKLDINIEYVKNHTIFQDIKIILKTLKVILSK